MSHRTAESAGAASIRGWDQEEGVNLLGPAVPRNSGSERFVKDS